MSLRRKSLIAVGIILFIIAAIFGISHFRKTDTPAPPPPPPPVSVAYHIPLHGLEVTYGTVKANESLSTILSGHVTPALIDRIAKTTRETFDVRKIKTGNRIAWIVTSDSIKQTRYFIYEINPIDFVVYDFTDSVRVYTDKKKITYTIKSDSGTITSSLWNCFVENNLDVGLALALSDVYAWTIDFYGLQKGDNFTVVYEELSVEEKIIGVDKILAARFNHNGKDFFAYHFDQHGKGDFFDENGQSLQRAFLKAPLKFSRISSRFSKSRMHPILRISRPHFGVDYSAPKGTPVVALGNGRVLEVRYKGGYGKFISIRHNSVYTTTYAHLSGYAKGIRPGANVTQGQVIGYVGSTGLSTGPHLDFRVYKNGTPTDPLRLESPPARPVEPAGMDKFRKLVLKMDSSLRKN